MLFLINLSLLQVDTTQNHLQHMTTPTEVGNLRSNTYHQMLPYMEFAQSVNHVLQSRHVLQIRRALQIPNALQILLVPNVLKILIAHQFLLVRKVLNALHWFVLSNRHVQL